MELNSCNCFNMNRARGVDLCEVGCGTIRGYITANHVFYICIFNMNIVYNPSNTQCAGCLALLCPVYVRDILSPHVYGTKRIQS